MEIVGQLASVQWSISLRTRTGEIVAEHNATQPMSTASIAKLLLLAEVARRLENGDLSEGMLLPRTAALQVGDSGVWQHMQADALSVGDLAVLVASVSDNLATNVLLDHVGIEPVQKLAKVLGLRDTALLDRVRDSRTDNDPPMLSVGTAAELSQLMVQIARGEVVSRAISERLARWMLLNTDMSMVASAFGLDPLSHTAPDRKFLVHSKTGTDADVRADVGFIVNGTETIAYAVIANWTDMQESVRDDVLDAMGRIGSLLRTWVAV